MEARHLAWLRLLHARIAPAALRRLLDTHGDAGAALAAGAAAWRAAGVRAPAREALARPDPDRLAAAEAWLQAAGHHLIGWDDPDYPALLRRLPDAPAALFVVGDVDALWRPQVAVVGSRHASADGRDIARRFARAFASAGLAVTSGLAAGIDAAAHRGALDTGGHTTAVLGTGPDLAYPRSHAGLQAEIAAAGTVVSEHPPGTPPLRPHFPARNRIIAGLALGVLVVEAAERSGALITARLAGELGREVFAIPGSIHNPLARGCHRLIRQGVALVESPGEVIEGLGATAAELAEALRGRLAEDAAPRSAPERSVPAAVPPDPDMAPLLAAIGFDPVPLDVIAERAGLTVPATSAILLRMEMAALIACEHGRYRRHSQGTRLDARFDAPPHPTAAPPGAGRG
ncbi:DNA-processing protein DprA [Coralloluteibacterium stylophorae]|uniref:DNA-processing protein DprA n=1 Tax=Coralloluteibacterium stylophorae TaxID=1776034 RepID=A0A8J7VX75_9GAMM|nr:DNA-processing protein DprA [Coralloluteibacterium stylophorae]MBS7457946.1 DNA-processing protein DprA [Coralloluteibacterium stylophorae]